MCRIIRLVLVTMLLTGTIAGCATQPPANNAAAPPAKSPEAPKIADPPKTPQPKKQAESIVYEIPGMYEVNVKKDITYKTLESGTELQMDVYHPAEVTSQQKLPAVIFIHGAASYSENLKNHGQYVSWGALVAKSGLAAVTFSYRGNTDNLNMEQGVSDIQDLMKYVQDHADSLKIDKDKIAVWVCSAGGPQALTELLKERPPYIKAIAAYYTVLDLRAMRTNLGRKSEVDAETLKKFTPANFLSQDPEKISPLLVVKAGKDAADLNESIDHFVKTAQANNVKLEYQEHPNGYHSFDIYNNDEESRTLIKRTVEFFKENLQK